MSEAKSITLTQLLSPVQTKAFIRAGATPTRIILGQIVMVESAALRLVEAGLWDRYYEAGPRPRSGYRYRFTEAGLAALSKAEPRP